jgi:hypothetical protein
LAIYFGSVSLAILAFLPKVFDYSVPINNESVAKLSQSEFRAFINGRNQDDMINDYADETLVLCRILAYRVNRVTWSARLLLAGIVLTFVTAVIGVALSA